MFKKLISGLPFSPALVGQLGFYAKRLRKEESIRKAGLVFVALALIVQSFAVFQPPEAANAASSNDFISGGFTTKQQYLNNYDVNKGNLKDLFKTLGISRSDIANSSFGDWNSHSDGGYSWGHLSRFSYAQGERSYTVPTSNGGSTTFYYRPLKLSDTKAYTIKNGSTYRALIGKTSSGMQFALLTICGNLVLKVHPPKVKCPTGTTGTYPDCVKKTCPTGTTGTYPDCKAPTCPTGTTGTYPDCKTPVASCDSLTIEKLVDNYHFTTVATAKNTATVKSYTYVIKRDGKVIETKTITSNQTSNMYTYNQSKEGAYTVEVTVNTSLGAQTGPNCVKTFNITAPEVCPQNPKILKISPECQPCPGDATLWIKDEKCAANLVQTKTAINTTQGSIDAQKTTARANDKITYTLTVENNGKADADTTIIERVDDVAEYATVIDTGGGTQGSDPDTKAAIISWPKVTVKPGQKVSRIFTVQMMSTIPAMGTGVSNPTSYDCKMMNTFGNQVSINVDCPIQKEVIETVTTQLPHTGPGLNMAIGGSVLAIVAFLYARTRQLKTEVRLIRRDFNTGTI